MDHKNLDVWKKSMELVIKVYNNTKDFPKEEMFGIVNQIRRAVVSIPSNIAEGCARYSPKETLRFLDVAFGSASELETQLMISEQLNYCNAKDLLDDINEIQKMISGLKKYITTKT